MEGTGLEKHSPPGGGGTENQLNTTVLSLMLKKHTITIFFSGKKQLKLELQQ